jgi:hypothetical protein
VDVADDALFCTIEQIQGTQPWGAVLDAGTGRHSLNWVCGLPSTRWTAVTGGDARRVELNEALASRIRPQDKVVTGNWQDHALCRGEVYDVVLADYLLGSLDGFAPYYQTELFERLRPHVGGRFYLVGLDPYPDATSDPGGRLILEIARLRDACILLAGHHCYREYPMEWTVQQLERSGYRILEAVRVPIVYRERFVNGQLDVCVGKLPHFRDQALALRMKETIADLRRRALAKVQRSGGIYFGTDHVVAAEVAG